MNKYRRFKYPFGGETPQEFADARRAYYENAGNTAMEAINATPVVNANTVTQPFDETSPREYLRQYTERVRPDLERRINEMNRKPSGNGKIIRNHDKLYDYYKDGDKLYYRKKGGKNWIDISDNDVAQKRINATIARNKKSYGGNKNTTKKEETSKATSSKAPDTQAAPKKQTTPVTQNTSNNQSRYSGVDSDYLLTALNPGAQSYDRITHNVNKMRRNQVEIPEAKTKDWRYYLNRKSQSQSSGTRVPGAKAYLADGIAQLPANYNKPRIQNMTKTAVANRDAGRKKSGFVGWFMNGIR